MKRSEQSLLLVLYLICTGFILNFFFLAQSLNFSDADTKKQFLIFAFVCGIIGFGKITGSVSKGFVLFFPLIFQINKVIFEISSVLELPVVLDQMQIRIAGTVILGMLLILIDIRKLIDSLKFKPVRFYCLFILVGLFTLVWAININAVISYIPTIIMLPVAYFVFLRLFEIDEKNIWYTCWGLIFTALFSLLFIWPDYFGIKWFSFLLADGGEGGSTAESVRAGGLVSRAAVALLLSSLIPFIYNFGIYYYPKYKKWVHLTGLILLLTLILSLSRMNIGATIIGLALALWYMVFEKVIKINIVFIFIGSISFALLAFFVISANGNSVEEAITRDTWDGRLEQFGAGLANFTQSYGFGVGMNNYLVSYISRNVLGANAWNFRSGNTLHSDYFRILGEYGLAGFLFYITFLISTFKTRTSLIIANPLVRGAKINIGVLAIAGLTEPAMNHDTTLIICGMYLAIMKYYQNKSSSEFLESMALKYAD